MAVGFIAHPEAQLPGICEQYSCLVAKVDHCLLLAAVTEERCSKCSVHSRKNLHCHKQNVGKVGDNGGIDLLELFCFACDCHNIPFQRKQFERLDDLRGGRFSQTSTGGGDRLLTLSACSRSPALNADTHLLSSSNVLQVSLFLIVIRRTM